MTAPALGEWCPQCTTTKPLESFVTKNGARFARTCSDCRERYSNWAALTPAERRGRVKRRERSGTGYLVRWNPRSQNRKLGPMPTSMTDMASCPSACGLRDGGCYAELGLTKVWWAKVATEGLSWREFVANVAALKPGTIWRHNDAGDLPGLDDHLDVRALDLLVRANRGKRGFSFTHKPLRRVEERRAVARANAEGFAVNLSADGLRAADRLADLGIAPVVAVVPSDAPVRLRTPAGRRVVICPGQTTGLTCLDCQLCAVPTRKAIVGFRAHGQGQQLVDELVRPKRTRKLEVVRTPMRAGGVS